MRENMQKINGKHRKIGKIDVKEHRRGRHAENERIKPQHIFCELFRIHPERVSQEPPDIGRRPSEHVFPVPGQPAFDLQDFLKIMEHKGKRQKPQHTRQIDPPVQRRHQIRDVHPHSAPSMAAGLPRAAGRAFYGSWRLSDPCSRARARSASRPICPTSACTEGNGCSGRRKCLRDTIISRPYRSPEKSNRWTSTRGAPSPPAKVGRTPTFITPGSGRSGLSPANRAITAYTPLRGSTYGCERDRLAVGKPIWRPRPSPATTTPRNS